MFEAMLAEVLRSHAPMASLDEAGADFYWPRVAREYDPPDHGAERVIAGLQGLELAAALTGFRAARGDSGDAVDRRRDEGDLLTLARGWEKVIAFAQAQQRQVIGTFAFSRMPAAVRDSVSTDPAKDTPSSAAEARRAVGPWGVGLRDWSEHEVAVELGCSVRAAEFLVEESLQLVTELPGTLAALGAGRISLPAARAVIAESAGVPTPVRQVVELQVLPGDTDPDLARTPAKLRAATRRAVLSADPHAAARREQAARARRGVRTSPGGDGMAALNIQGSIAAVAGAFENLDAHARHLVAQPGEQRPVDAIRSDLALDTLTGRLHLGGPGVTPPPCTGEPDPDPDAVRRPLPRVRAEIVVTGADTTLAGLDEAPGQLSGYGPITAGTLRELVARASTVHALSTDPASGAVTAVTVLRDGKQHPHVSEKTCERAVGYTPPAAMARFVIARDRTCRFPGCRRRAERCDLDHTIRYPDGPTEPGNLGALCRRHHRLRHTPRWTLTQPSPGTFVWTTPTGRTYTVEPPDPLDPD